MTSGFGGQGYTNQQTRALSSIENTPGPDLSQGQEAMIRMLQGHEHQIKFLAGQMKQAQAGINEATQNPIQQIQQFIADITVLLGGGQLLTGAIDFGDLEYILPALGALFGFGDSPLPISLFDAASKFFLGYVVPQQQFVDVINVIITNWLGAIGIDPEFIADIRALTTAIGDLFDGVVNLFPSLNELLDALGITATDLGPLGQALKPILDLFRGTDLSAFGNIIEFITDAISPFIDGLTAVINWSNSVLAVLGFGNGDVVNSPIDSLTKPFENLVSLLGGLNLFEEGFDVSGTWATIVDGIIDPLNLLAPLVDGLLSGSVIPGLDASKIVSGVFPMERVAGLLEALASGDVAGVIEALLGVPGDLTDLSAWAGTVPNLVGGLLNGSWIPALDASKITSGLLGLARIPGLPASKVTSGTFAQSMVTGLPGAIASLLGIQTSRTNLVIDGGFDDPAQWPRSAGVMSTEQKHSGTQSRKLTSNGTSSQQIYLNDDYRNLNPGTADAALWRVQPGEKFYLEGWIYVEPGNTFGVGNAPRLNVAATDSTDVTTIPAVSVANPGWGFFQSTAGSWQKMSGWYTVPAGCDRLRAYLTAGYSNDAPGNVYHVDDVMVREVTEAQNVVERLFGAVGSSATSVLAAAIPLLDGSKISTGTVDLARLPSSLLTNASAIAASAITGLLDAARIPTLDASKIGSGTFAQNMVAGLPAAIAAALTSTSPLDATKLVGNVASSLLSGVLGAGLIPPLDASKITSGTFAQNMVTGLPAAIAAALTSASPLDATKLFGSVASSLLSGVLGAGLIPPLDASKVTTGQFPQSMVNLTSIASSLLSGTIGAGLIPTLDASKIGSGTLLTSLIPSLAASIIGSGTLDQARIPGLDGSKITSGMISQSFLNITSLPASILSGTLSPAVTGLQDVIDGVVGGSGNPISSLINSLFGTKTKTNQIVDDIQAGWQNTTPGGTPTPVLDTIQAIRSAIVGDYTVDVITSSTVWTKPAGLTECHVAVCNGGGRGFLGGNVGGSGNTAEGGDGGIGGGWLVQELNPDDIPATVDATVGAGQSVTDGALGGTSSFGSLVIGISGEGGIGQPWGFVGTSSLPGNGGKGGTVSGTSTGSQMSSRGGSTPLASGGAPVAGISSGTNGTGTTGNPGAAASMTGPSKAGGAGGAGGGSRYFTSTGSGGTTVGGTGGPGGFPGGAGGGGGAAGRGLAAGGRQGGPGGIGANGVVLVFRKGAA